MHPVCMVEMQERIVAWGERCFGSDHMRHPHVRALRLLEEAVEFAQSVGIGRNKAHQLVNYIYNRPVGEPSQELGGVLVTALAAAHGLDVDAADVLQAEVVRIEGKSPDYFAGRNAVKSAAGFGARE